METDKEVTAIFSKVEQEQPVADIKVESLSDTEFLLDCTESFDQDGGDVSCRWIITEGTTVVLTDSGETLTADLDKKGSYTWQPDKTKAKWMYIIVIKG